VKVHLIRSPELTIETYGNVLNLLQQFPGPYEFIAAETEKELTDLQTRVWEDEDSFMEKEVWSESVQYSPNFDKKMLFPAEEKYQSWDYFFGLCRQFRVSKAIPESDHVFLLTTLGNDMNWFGSMGPSMKDYFIQTSHWDSFFGAEVDERFPVAYEVALWLVRHHMFDNRQEIIDTVHEESRGCANDFCQNKADIILKMRTADLCTKCMDIVHSRDTSPLVIGQLFDIMDGIRMNLTFRERSKIIRKPSKMEIRGYVNRIFLTDLGDLEVRLNPKEKAIYMFYLNHPEGIHLTELQDYRDEIYSYYTKYTNQFEQVEIDKSLDRLINPLDNNINVILSRIKRKFKDLVGDDILENYLIGGEHGGIKKIYLDREYIKLI